MIFTEKQTHLFRFIWYLLQIIFHHFKGIKINQNDIMKKASSLRFPYSHKNYSVYHYRRVHNHKHIKNCPFGKNPSAFNNNMQKRGWKNCNHTPSQKGHSVRQKRKKKKIIIIICKYVHNFSKIDDRTKPNSGIISWIREIKRRKKRRRTAKLK